MIWIITQNFLWLLTGLFFPLSVLARILSPQNFEGILITFINSNTFLKFLATVFFPSTVRCQFVPVFYSNVFEDQRMTWLEGWSEKWTRKPRVHNEAVCMEFSPTRISLLSIKFAISKTKTKYPSITEETSLIETFSLINVCFELRTPFIWWRICRKRSKIMLCSLGSLYHVQFLWLSSTFQFY